MLTDEQKITIKDFVEKEPIELVYLFGSQAGGVVGKMSDFDFAVLFDKELSDREKAVLKLKMIAYLTDLLGTDKVDVLDLNSAPAAFRFEAFKNRGEIYSRSNSNRVDFEVSSMNEYFDRIYFIKRHTRESLKLFGQKGL